MLTIGSGAARRHLYFVLALTSSSATPRARHLAPSEGPALFLLLLSLFFRLVVLVISKLPVLERFPWWYVLIVLAALVDLRR